MTWLRQRTPEAAIAKHSGAKRFAYRVGREGCVRTHTCELSRAMEVSLPCCLSADNGFAFEEVSRWQPLNSSQSNEINDVADEGAPRRTAR